MKAQAWVTIEQEVEVDVRPEDVLTLYDEMDADDAEPRRFNLWFGGFFGRLLQVIDPLSADRLARVNADALRIVADRLEVFVRTLRAAAPQKDGECDQFVPRDQVLGDAADCDGTGYYRCPECARYTRSDACDNDG
jgi:hypothetical protein